MTQPRVTRTTRHPRRGVHSPQPGASASPWDVSPDDFPSDGFAADQIEFLLRYAVLAPSTHNTQPWLFKINAMDVELHMDGRRAVPVVDPGCRELVISCGAALFNLRTAAEYFGHTYRVELFPDSSQPNLLARMHLGLQGETRSEDIALFHAITRRRTNRLAFREDAVPDALLGACEAVARREGAWFHCFTTEEDRNVVADLVAEADRRQWADRHFRQELAAWLRPHAEQSRDGMPVQAFGVKDWLAFAGPVLVRTFDRGGGVAAKDREIALHSPVLAVLGTEADDPASWLAAGQALQAVLLSARSEDVWSSHLNQPIEVTGLREQLGAMTGRPGHPQILLRLGYGEEVPPAPRRSHRETLIRHQTTHP